MKKNIGNKTIVIFLITLFFAVNATAIEDPEFILPDAGCPMAHADPHMSNYCRLPVPTGDVDIVWHNRGLPFRRTGFSSWASGNGNITAVTFWGLYDCLVIYDYDGNRIWASGTLLNPLALSSAPMVDIHNRVIACDNKRIIMVDPYDYDEDEKIVEWNSKIPYGGIPWSPVITEDGTIIIATDMGPVYAYNSSDGALLAYKFLKPDEPINLFSKLFQTEDRGFFSTINTPCVKGNRIFISTAYKSPRDFPPLLHFARLYAIDVDSHNPNATGRLTVAWNYEFGGPSGASPLLINNTIYFDGDRPQPQIRSSPHVFAVTDMGTYGKEEWKKSMITPVDANFALDPRGGFWIVDSLRNRLVHYSAIDGNILEKIVIDDLSPDEGRFAPSSCITMCGNDTNPVIVVAATNSRIKTSSYIVAIDLANNNSLLWKVKIPNRDTYPLDFSFGQYPVLIKNGEPRVIFSSVSGGVWAIGTKNTTN